MNVAFVKLLAVHAKNAIQIKTKIVIRPRMNLVLAFVQAASKKDFSPRKLKSLIQKSNIL